MAKLYFNMSENGIRRNAVLRSSIYGSIYYVPLLFGNSLFLNFFSEYSNLAPYRLSSRCNIVGYQTAVSGLVTRVKLYKLRECLVSVCVFHVDSARIRTKFERFFQSPSCRRTRTIKLELVIELHGSVHDCLTEIAWRIHVEEDV